MLDTLLGKTKGKAASRFTYFVIDFILSNARRIAIAHSGNRSPFSLRRCDLYKSFFFCKNE